MKYNHQRIRVPRNFEVQPVKPGTPAYDRATIATCGTCGLSWDDGIVTSMTPAPSARCPFECFHAEPEPPRASSLTITIVMDSPAFAESTGNEVRRILKKFADQVHAVNLCDGDHVKIYDSTGNHVGDAIVE